MQSVTKKRDAETTREGHLGLLPPAIAIWLALAIFAIANGITREIVLVPAMGVWPAHVLSTGILVAAVAIGAGLFVAKFARDASRQTLLTIGAGWTTLTTGFEFLFGHYVDGKSWAVLLADYNVLAGRVWITVPLTLLLAPLVADWYLRR